MPPGFSERRAIIYGRLSASADGIGVDTQIVEGRRVCDREGWPVLGVYRDDGISASRYAKNKDRAGWRRVMEAIDSELRRGDVLVVREISRASRDRTVSAGLLAACSESAVWLCIGGKLHDPNDPDDSFLLDLTSALAVRESATISKRVQLAVDAREERGRPHGRIAYGYKRLYSEATGKPDTLVPDPQTAPIVQEIARRVLAGESLYAVTADLNARNVPSPLTVTRLRNWRPTIETPWRPQQVRRIATSATAAGLRLAKGRVRDDVEATWEPLVSRADHNRLVELAGDRLTSYPRSDNQARHLLTHIATCGVCSAELVARRNNTTPSYSCPVGHVSRSRRQVDDWVVTVTIARLESPELRAALFADDGDAAAEIEQARAEAADLRAKLEGWYDAAAGGDVSPQGLSKIEGRLLERIADAEQRARPRPSSATLDHMLTGDVRATWSAAPLVLRREVVRELMRVLVHRTKRGQRVLDEQSIEIVWRV